LQVKTLQGFFFASARKIFSIILHIRPKKNTITPFAPPYKYGRHTTSSSYWAPFPLDLWGIMSSGFSCKVSAIESWLSIAEPQPTFALQMACKPNAEPSWLERLFAWVREKC
jgi:hypothetical protein